MDNNISSILSSVMDNQDLMDRIKGIVKSNNGDTGASLEDVVSLIASSTGSPSNDNTTKESSNKDNESSSTNEFISSLSHSISKNSSLLIALKPYLSKERCHMIDNVVKISQLANALKLI